MVNVRDLVWLVPALPLAGFLLNLLGKRLPKGLVSLVGCGSVGLAFLLSLALLRELLAAAPADRLIQQTLYSWITVGDFEVAVNFRLDPLSALMILVVTGVGFLIHVYSVGYMAHDERYRTYFAYLNLFVFAMLMLVLGENFLVMFLGWEGVGLCSYLLIGHWFERETASKAAQKAFIVNRVGDFGFLLGIMLIYWNFKSLNFSDVFAKASQMQVSPDIITAIALLLFVGACGKSAQLPLHVWLPDAMEGPTPVSALIHAATMVTAGVYMVARCHVLYQLAPIALGVVAVVGAATAFFAATIALVQNDIKRVLAYSTISQIGYMFLACGVGAFSVGMFHLMTHAFFKALLFLAAGSVIHALSGQQDIRKMGALAGPLRATGITFWVGALALAGVPGLSGFFSKDEILAEALHGPNGHPGLWIIGLLTAAMTAFYIFRLTFRVFHRQSSWGEGVHPHESAPIMTWPLGALALLSLVGGYAALPALVGGENVLARFLEPVFAARETVRGPALPLSENTLMVISSVVALAGVLAAYWFYIKRPELPGALVERAGVIYQMLVEKYRVDEAYNAVFVEGGKTVSTVLAEPIDLGGVDWAANTLANTVGSGSHLLRKFQTGFVRNYALGLLFGALLLLLFMLRF